MPNHAVANNAIQLAEISFCGSASAAGKASGNEQLEAEGKNDQTKANLKQAGENVKDAFKE